MEVRSIKYCVSQIIYLSDRIPQYLHDICLQTALLAEANYRIVEPETIELGAENWIEQNGRQSRELIRTLLGKGSQKFDHKSRVVYAISKCDTIHFYPNTIEEILRDNFPSIYQSKKTQVVRTLRKLAEGESRLLKKDPTDDYFRVVNPKVRSVVRHCLVKGASETGVFFKDGER